MELIKPFRGLVANNQWVNQIIAPPYDVISRHEAKALASSRWNILHLTRAEIDCDAETHAYDDHVYQQAKQNGQALLQNPIFNADQQDCYYIYRIESGKQVQMGLVSLISMQAYSQHRVRKHEHTNMQVEFDRVRIIKALNAQVSPALLAYRQGAFITDTLQQLSQQSKPLLNRIPFNDEFHSLWRIANPAIVAKLTEAVRDLGYVYIADGHHRLSAMSRVALEHPNDVGYQYALAVLFPEMQLKTLPYHRVLTDLNGLTPNALLEKLNPYFKIETRTRPVQPTKADQFGLYLQGQWYRLTAIATGSTMTAVTFLHDHVIKPLFNIVDARSDVRIRFISDKQGIAQLIQQVEALELACGFTLPPISVQDVFAIADACSSMPIKSTWFSPKLCDGLIVYSMEDI